MTISNIIFIFASMDGKINYEEFKELELFKKRIRKELLEELQGEVINLRWADAGKDEIRDGGMTVAADAEDAGFAHAKRKMLDLLEKL